LSLPPLPAALPLARIAAGTLYWRIHRRRSSALHFDRSDRARFNAPAGEFGVCYLGDSLEVAFLETLVRGSRHRLVARGELADRFAARLRTVREVRLLRLHSDALVQLALPADAPNRVPYAECQALSLQAHAHAEGVDGIEYRSRWDDSRVCVALFERSDDALLEEGHVRLDDLPLIRPILRHYDIGVV
jgi:hypothetical protein